MLSTSIPETLNLGNIANGAALEVFENALTEVLKNIADVSTPAESKRKLALEFDFKPLPDRSGASVTFTCKTKLASVEPHQSTIFVQRTNTGIRAFPRDIRQQALFNKPEESRLAVMPTGSEAAHD